MKRKILILIILALILSAGCTISNENKATDDSSISVDGQDREIIDRSESISDIVVELYGVDDATTVIFNDRALIGVKLSYDNKLDDNIRNNVIDVVTGFDNQITEVKVTQDNKLFMQIDDIMNELILGKSYDTFVDEINKISDKIK